MILIADSGSTKTTWVLINEHEIIKSVSTAGYNPYYYEEESLENIVTNELAPNLSGLMPEKIYYYGSGCSSELACNRVMNVLSANFSDALITINHDLTGAAVALLKNKAGIACILGTGSNSCLWDGEKIIENVPSVGYLLGDEGSGTYLGMRILKGIMEQSAPNELIDRFYESYKLTFESILDILYSKAEPNKFLSSISLFASQNINAPWVKQQVANSFTDFIDNQIKRYINYKSYPVCFTGSVAYHYREILNEVMKDNNINLNLILKEPIEGLIEYHQNNS